MLIVHNAHMSKGKRHNKDAQDVDAQPGERLFTTLPDQEFADAQTFLRRRTRLPDSELLRQAIIRLYDEVKEKGELVVKVLAA